MVPPRSFIDEPTTSFIESGVSILAASSDRENLPTIVRAVGCRVSRDRRKVTLLVPPYEPLLAAVSATGTIAVTFTRPSTHQTIQLKGWDAERARTAENDPSIMRAYADAFVAELCPLGYAEDLVRAMVWCDPEALCAVGFGPTAAFQQTPGPNAGAPLKA